MSGFREGLVDAWGRVAVFLHGLCENEAYWQRNRAEAAAFADSLGSSGAVFAATLVAADRAAEVYSDHAASLSPPKGRLLVRTSSSR